MAHCIADESLGSTGFSYTLSLISGKYKMTILYTLMEFGVVRFNEIQRYIGGISYKTLSVNLKELEADGLVCAFCIGGRCDVRPDGGYGAHHGQHGVLALCR